MSYESFAYLYDRLMDEAPYDKWLAFFERAVEEYDVGKQPILEVGSGTGELLLRLCERGYEVSGVDLSAHMLSVARDKLQVNGYQPLLIEQDMRHLELGSTFASILVFCDSLNYLLTEDDVFQAFKQFHLHLETGGLLLFDVHSVNKIANGFIDQTFADAGEDISYIWQSFSGKEENSVEHELTFFVREPNGYYERMEEFHVQRTFSIDIYESLLEKAGFVVEKVIADFEHQVTEESERIFFVAKKKESTK